MLLPRSCPICSRPGPAPCPACVATLDRAPALPPPPGVDRCRAVVAYDGAGRELIARLKYRNARSALPWLAEAMAATVRPEANAGGFEVVTWVPTTRARRRQRGFDQAELLARAVSRRLRLPCRGLLRRGDGPPQTGRSLEMRRIGPILTARRTVRGTVLVVDDVVTSGSTVAGAARALRAAGASSVHVVAAARTPPRRRSGGGTLR